MTFGAATVGGRPLKLAPGLRAIIRIAYALARWSRIARMARAK